MAPRFLEAGFRSLANAAVLLFTDPGSDCDHQFARRPGGAEVRLGVADILDAIAAQLLDVLEGFGHPFPGQPIERPGNQVIGFAAESSCTKRIRWRMQKN